MKASSTTQLPPTTSSRILNDCKLGQEKIKQLADWIVAHPWIDKASLYLAIPGSALLIFEPHSKDVLVKNMGASGWFAYGDEAKKIVDGVTISLRRERPTYSGEISEEEMKGI